jgi:undecaprenyl-diphosphatase
MKGLSLDQLLFLFFNEKHSPFFDWLMSLASNALTWIPVYLFGLFILLRILKFMNPSSFISNSSLVLFSLLVIVLICYQWLPLVFPYFVNRIKPCYDVDLSSVIHTVGDVCGDKYGFYAFRPCTVFALSTFLCFAFHETVKWMKLLLILWAIFVSYSRIYLGAHYPVNVVVSALSGIFIGYMAYRAYNYIKDSVLVI